MNPAALQKLIADAITEDVFLNWRFYVALASIAVLCSVVNALLEGWGKKRGEIAATKADFEEIKRQLGETTNVAKSVEVAIVRGDWIQREKNILIRTKLELLVQSAFSIAAWARDTAENYASNEPVKHPPAIDTFNMLSRLYFLELQPHTVKITHLYSECIQTFGQVRLDLIPLDIELKNAEAERNTEKIVELGGQRHNVVQGHFQAVMGKATAVHFAAVALADDALKIMVLLTTVPIEN